MIKKEKIEKYAMEALADEYFIVSIQVKKGNIIDVIIDGDNGVSIQKCIDVSRSVEKELDRDIEDFELNVSSAGLGKPFTVPRQYKKNIGKEVEVTPANDKQVSGVIKSVDNEGFDLEVKTIEKEKKKKFEVIKTLRFNFADSPKVKNIISFK
ncbi:MAG: ribosome assembly cofactor RimP [Prolixibacteraceae bacterium]|jgi:ribosome maturation factor RimP|nr:ribosome assembly cofactor RimP [Prolixibacteraceae bacterium]